MFSSGTSQLSKTSSAVSRPAHAELVELLRHLETLEALLDQEGGDAFRARAGIGLGIDHQHISFGRVGDPHLGAVENVFGPALFGLEPHRDDVGTGTGFTHRQRADVIAGNQLRQIALFLIVVAVTENLVHAKIGMRAVRQADTRRAAAHLFHRHAMLEIALPRAAPFFIDCDAVQAERAKLRPQIAREGVAAVDLVGAWRDLVRGETAHGIAQHVGGLAKAEIELEIGIGDHACLSIGWPASRSPRSGRRLVRSRRVELPRVAPLAPQASASTIPPRPRT